MRTVPIEQVRKDATLKRAGKLKPAERNRERNRASVDEEGAMDVGAEEATAVDLKSKKDN